MTTSTSANTVIVTAKLRKLRMSPRKVRLLADMIRGRLAADALTHLSFSDKLSGRPLRTLVASAMANAARANLAAETLKIAEIRVDGGQTQYRFRPRAMGRSAPIRRRTSHIAIVLSGEMNDKSIKEDKKDYGA